MGKYSDNISSDFKNIYIVRDQYSVCYNITYMYLASADVRCKNKRFLMF